MEKREGNGTGVTCLSLRCEDDGGFARRIVALPLGHLAYENRSDLSGLRRERERELDVWVCVWVCECVWVCVCATLLKLKTTWCLILSLTMSSFVIGKCYFLLFLFLFFLLFFSTVLVDIFLTEFLLYFSTVFVYSYFLLFFTSVFYFSFFLLFFSSVFFSYFTYL